MPLVKDSHPGISSYPKRIVTLETIDCGPMEDGGGNCSHCGAEGRWIHRFLCDDGKIYGAMSGCIKLFPLARKTRLTIMADGAMDKLKANSRGKEAKLASWFSTTMDALRKLERGEIDLKEAEGIASREWGRREAWLIDNGYRKGGRR